MQRFVPPPGGASDPLRRFADIVRDRKGVGVQRLVPLLKEP